MMRRKDLNDPYLLEVLRLQGGLCKSIQDLKPSSQSAVLDALTNLLASTAINAGCSHIVPKQLEEAIQYKVNSAH